MPVGVAQVPSFLKYVEVLEPNWGPLVIVFAPLNLAIYPDVPDPVTLFVMLGVTVTVCALPPLGVTVNPFVPFANVYVVLLSVNLASLGTSTATVCPPTVAASPVILAVNLPSVLK